MIQLNSNYLYAKGTCNVIVRDPLTGNVDYQSNKTQTNQVTTTCDMGEIRAGMGNAIATQLPSNSAVNLTLTQADFSMATRAMQLGSAVTYNAVSPVCEAITATTTVLTVTNTPVAPQGYSTIICNVNDGSSTAGTAYTINPTTREVVGFTATFGVTYTVFYWMNNASAQQVIAYSMFSPAVKHVTVQIGVFSSLNTSAASQSSLAGYLYGIIPRMQFQGKADTDGSQTANVVSELTGTALTYDDNSATTCTDCGLSKLAYWVYVPNGSVTQDVIGLAVVGGMVSLPVSSTAQIPVRYVMKDNSLVVPNYGDLTYTLTATTNATVNATGLLTSTATAGDTECTITLTATPTISTVCNVEVTSA